MSTLVFLFYYCLIFPVIILRRQIALLTKELDQKTLKTQKTLLSQASSPLTMSMKPFLCMSYSTIFLLHRDHDEVVTTLMVCHRTSSLILALCMTLPSYEGYAGGSR